MFISELYDSDSPTNNHLPGKIHLRVNKLFSLH